MASARCLASVRGALLSGGTALGQQAQQLRSATGLTSWLAAPAAATWQQQARHSLPGGRSLRVFSSASQAYWDDDSKAKVNVFADYTVYKVCVFVMGGGTTSFNADLFVGTAELLQQ